MRWRGEYCCFGHLATLAIFPLQPASPLTRVSRRFTKQSGPFCPIPPGCHEKRARAPLDLRRYSTLDAVTADLGRLRWYMKLTTGQMPLGWSPNCCRVSANRLNGFRTSPELRPALFLGDLRPGRLAWRLATRNTTTPFAI